MATNPLAGRAWFESLGRSAQAQGLAIDHQRVTRREWPRWAQGAWARGWLQNHRRHTHRPDHRTCCRCGRHAPVASFTAGPGSIFIMLEQTARELPTGYYRIEQPFDVRMAALEQSFPMGAARHVAHLDIPGQHAADQRDLAAELLCAACQNETQTLIKTAFKIAPLLPKDIHDNHTEIQSSRNAHMGLGRRSGFPAAERYLAWQQNTQPHIFQSDAVSQRSQETACPEPKQKICEEPSQKLVIHSPDTALERHGKVKEGHRK